MNRTNDSFELSPIKAMELAASKIPGVISLAQGIPSFPTPQVMKDFVIERIREGRCDKYSLTTGLTELREEISLSLMKDHLRYDPDSEILVTVGSIEGITASILALTEPGDEVLLPSPSYVSYQGSIRLARCEPKFVALDEENNFDFHVERILSAITRKTKVFLYCSPNNPTGTLFSEAKTRELIEILSEHGISVVIDEVYKDFTYTDTPHFTPMSIAETRSFAIRVCSFSKAYAMTGWRVGFLHADRSLVQRVLKYHDAMVTCAPVVSQYGAIAALRYGEPYLQEFKAEFRRRRDYALTRLDAMTDAFDYQVPKATYFVFPRLKDVLPLARESRAFAYDLLEKAHLAVVPGSAFGPSGESHIRISFGREMADSETGFDRLENYISEKLRKTSFEPKRVTDSGSHKKSSFVDEPLRKSAVWTLGTAARLSIRRKKQKIIGIVGLRGKTVVKRVVYDLLSPCLPILPNPLSFNTSVGFPISALQLDLPRSIKQKAMFPFSLGRQLFAKANGPKYLLLEYGVLSTKDARELLQVGSPDYIIYTGSLNTDPLIDRTPFFDGLQDIFQSVPAEKIFWREDPALPEHLRTGLRRENLLTPEAYRGSVAITPGGHYYVNGDYVGESASIGVLAALRLADDLGVIGSFSRIPSAEAPNVSSE